MMTEEEQRYTDSLATALADATQRIADLEVELKAMRDWEAAMQEWQSAMREWQTSR